MSTKENATRQSKGITTRQIVFAAMAIALATVISTVIKLPSLPNGGSVTLFSMLLVTLVGYWYGPAVGITAAVAYGILQFVVGPYVVHPAQVLLDYPLAFGALGLSGFFYRKKNGLLTGYIAGVIGRFFFHMVSGLIFYTEYVGGFSENMAAVWASTLYNLSYILPEAILTIVLLAIPTIKKAMASIKAMAQSDAGE
ncbi:MAG: energy-coupled thiamine transporter ThiT [Lachnospiraceae bacterium]|nr:energy-coupled thiamine transporter ThiT [Lachnospiraceae bacterium]